MAPLPTPTEVEIPAGGAKDEATAPKETAELSTKNLEVESMEPTRRVPLLKGKIAVVPKSISGKVITALVLGLNATTGVGVYGTGITVTV